MYEYLLFTLAVSVVLILGLLLWLLRGQQKLAQHYQRLEAQLQRSNDDLAALCSAAIAVDRRLLDSEQRLNSLAGQVDTHSKVAVVPQPAAAETQTALKTPPAQGYEAAIQKIRSGTGVDDLVRDFGLTRDEAVLLNRLHGGNR